MGLFRDRNFAVSNLMMLVLGMALYGSTVLLPQYVQVWMGWSAQDAGMALSPGGLTVICLLPLVGRLVSRVDARYLIAFGFTALSVALYHMSRTIYPGMDFHTAMMLRIYQSIGLAFLFVPINTAAYAYLPRDKNNAASGLMNLARNIGGSVGISVVTTMLARRAQYHQHRLSSHLSASNPQFWGVLQGMAHALEARGFSPVDAMHKAYALLQGTAFRQAGMLAYIDNFWLLGVAILAMVPMVFLMKRPRSGGIAVH